MISLSATKGRPVLQKEESKRSLNGYGYEIL